MGWKQYETIEKGAERMQLSARNQLPGTVKAVKEGAVMAEVVVTLEGRVDVVSAITVDSVRRLKLAVGSKVTVVDTERAQTDAVAPEQEASRDHWASQAARFAQATGGPRSPITFCAWYCHTFSPATRYLTSVLVLAVTRSILPSKCHTSLPSSRPPPCVSK